jgi:hypothetical protein
MTQTPQKLPAIIDLQPPPEVPPLRLPAWMQGMFAVLYLATIVGGVILLKQSVAFLHKYNDKVQAERVSALTIVQINALQKKLAEFKNVEKEYQAYKLRQRQIVRMGPLLEWVPSAVGKAQRASTLTIQQAGDYVSLRMTLEKPIADSLVKISKGPEDFLVFSSSEEAPKFVDLPQGQKPGVNNEFTSMAIQLKRQQ